MRISDVSRYALSVFTVYLVAGCGGTTQPPVAGQVHAASHATTGGGIAAAKTGYKSLYSFEGPPDGEQPTSGLIAFKGVLFGTTSLGGYNGSPCNSCGTVYWISSAGFESVLYRFTGAPDGAYPQAGLTAMSSELYGTTYAGGRDTCSGECGTVFAVTAAGRERIVYSFMGGADGANPNGGLLKYNGRLYGTTEHGGDLGTIYSVGKYGDERQLHVFSGGSDGANPIGNLIPYNGVLYGVTTNGGSGNDGTIYRVDPHTHLVLIEHSFTGNDGENPVGITVFHGKVFGATSAGGPDGKGVLFSMDGYNRYHIVHAFRGTPKGDAAYPAAPPIAVNDVLYGAARGGGAHGNGAVYEATASGLEALLYSFDRTPDGVHPESALTYQGGKLYGTTVNGGRPPSYGTVFRVAP